MNPTNNENQTHRFNSTVKIIKHKLKPSIESRTCSQYELAWARNVVSEAGLRATEIACSNVSGSNCAIATPDIMTKIQPFPVK